MPPDTNRGTSFPGERIRMGGRKLAVPTCRDAVLSTLTSLSRRAGEQVFTVREVHAEMVAQGSSCAEATVFKAMQRMKGVPVRPPYARLARAGREGFYLVEAHDVTRYVAGSSASSGPDRLNGAGS